MSLYASAPAFSPGVDIVYFEEEQLYRARVQSHGREYMLERGSRDELMREIEQSIGYEYELLMRFIDPEGISRSTFRESMKPVAQAPEMGINMSQLLDAGLGMNAALCVIMPSPGLVRDALHVAKRFGGSFTSRVTSRKGSKVIGGISKRTKFAAVIGGVTLVGRSRHDLKRKVSRRKMHQTQLIMNTVRTQQIQRLRDKTYNLSSDDYRPRGRDLPDINDNLFRGMTQEPRGDWRQRAGVHRMRMIDKREAAMSLY